MNRLATATLALAIGATAILVGAMPAAAKTHHHRMTAKTARADYLKAVAPDNAAITTFDAQANAWSASTTDAQAEADAQPLITADKKFELRLEDTNWPASKDRTAADQLAADCGQLDASLESLSTVNLLNDEEWLQAFTSAANTTGVGANVLRHDLGLPPA